MRVCQWMLGGLMGVTMVLSGGCVSLEEFNQTKMAQRNLEVEKASLEQELFDARTLNDSLRGRTDSLEGQLSANDQLIANLQDENNTLEESFKTAQSLAERLADRPIGPVNVGAGALPAELDAALRQFAASHANEVVYDASAGTVKWKSDLLFALASDIVKESAANTLKQFTRILQSNVGQPFDVIVVGHTDNVRISKPQTKAKHPTNWHLSAHRAIAVANVLKKQGLPAARVGIMGYGQYRPVVENSSNEHRARNRRVEMYLVPAGSFSAGAMIGQTQAFTGQKDDKTK